ncbi:hypothetical protein [Rhodanobacter ginsengiterrae]|uniref:hypothetical protein n=1 Tax=Rhodanobacter ginsengiterrae TaxID=2008451 RepID=UPI003CF67815
MASIRPQKREVSFLFLLVVVHFIAGVAFYAYTSNGVTDSQNYFEWSSDSSRFSVTGSGLIVAIVAGLRGVGVDDYYAVLMIFTGLSAWGICAAYASIVREVQDQPRGKRGRLILRLCVLLPGLHFWTAAVGKDAIVEFTYGLLFIGLIRSGKSRILLIGLCILILFLVRPYLGFCMGMTFFGFALVTQTKSFSVNARVLSRIFILLVGAVAAISFYVFFLSYIQKYSSDGFQSLADFEQSREGIYAGVGSGFDASQYPFPVRFGIFLLGGIPWRLSKVGEVFAMGEGFVTCLLLIAGSRYLWLVRRIGSSREYQIPLTLSRYALIYSMVLAAVLTLGATNLGIIARQRIMVYLPLVACFYMSRRAYFSAVQAVRYEGLLVDVAEGRFRVK